MNTTEQPYDPQFLKDKTLKKNPFKVSENYFDNLSDNITSEYYLKQTCNKTGYTTPDQYFETFKVKLPSRIITLLPYTSVAVAATVLMGFFLFNTQQNLKQAESELSKKEIIEYFANEDGIEANENINYSSLDNLNIDLEFEEYDVLEF